MESYSQPSKERNVYNYNSAIEIRDYKISAMDVHGIIFYFSLSLIDNVLIIGSEKGYVYPYEITMNSSDKKKVCLH